MDKVELRVRLLLQSQDVVEVFVYRGESLAEIWMRKKTLNLDALKLLKGDALHEATGLIRAREPSWATRIEERMQLA